MPEPVVLFALLFGAALLVSSVGFYRLVWFISVGYGYAIAGLAVVLAVVVVAGDSGMGWLLAVQLGLLFVYGVRLGTHVLVRDRNASYRKAARENYGEFTGSLAIELAIWISVAMLYVLMFSPAAFHGLHDGGPAGWSFGGLAIMLAGLALEWLADRQKTAAKRNDPERFCDRGLFAVQRTLARCSFGSATGCWRHRFSPRGGTGWRRSWVWSASC